MTDEQIEAALKAFNTALKEETSNTLYTYWNDYECVPAMRAALEAASAVSVPDQHEPGSADLYMEPRTTP